MASSIPIDDKWFLNISVSYIDKIQTSGQSRPGSNSNVMPLLLGDINNSYPRIFSSAVSSPTLIEKSKIFLIWALF